ncbi:PASTA domain-containing protein [Mycolicibacterium sp.]|uniref:PASTA domain-containing protein n=1 Tax=Mycolicibacterium sp. TaxID=2320850 RepID=UPI0037CA514C
MKPLLLIVVSTVCFVGACSSGGRPVAARDSAVTSSAAPTRTVTAHPPTTIVMPDLRGMYWSDADPALRTLGWTGVLSKAPDLPNSPYRTHQIATQIPAPGQVIAADAMITLQFAQ